MNNIWPKDRPFKVSRNFATGQRLTRTTENYEFFATEQDARILFGSPRERNECSRTLCVLFHGVPNNYGNPDTMKCLDIKRFRKP